MLVLETYIITNWGTRRHFRLYKCEGDQWFHELLHAIDGSLVGLSNCTPAYAQALIAKSKPA